VGLPAGRGELAQWGCAWHPGPAEERFTCRLVQWVTCPQAAPVEGDMSTAGWVGAGSGPSRPEGSLPAGSLAPGPDRVTCGSRIDFPPRLAPLRLGHAILLCINIPASMAS